MKGMKSIVVAFDKNYGIGADNDLLWQRDLPSDLQHFKDLTMSHAIIMGRRTFESIGRALPGRRTIVVSSTLQAHDDVAVVPSLNAAYQLCGDADAFVIGGAQLYEEAINSVDYLYVTEVEAEFPQATVFFPAINLNQWKEISREHHDADEQNKYPYDFVEYVRR